MKFFLNTFIISICSICSIANAWNQVGSDIAGSFREDEFGDAVAINYDGTIIAAGAPQDSDKGYVKVFEWNSLSASWDQLGTTLSGVFSEDMFGEAISLSSNGMILAVGARMNDNVANNAGHVRVFQFDGFDWVQMGSDIDGTGEGDTFGTSLALSADGNRLVVGAPWSWRDGDYSYAGHVQSFYWDGSTWLPLGSEITTATTEDRFGQSVCMNQNGNIIGVGATVDDTNGFVRIYEWVGSEWLQLGNEIISPTIADNFGGSISMSDDGKTIIIGDQFNDDLGNNVGECVVYSFDEDTSSWSQLGSDINGPSHARFFGSTVDINNDATIIAVGADYGKNASSNTAGTVTVYHWIGDDWYQYDEVIAGESHDKLDPVALNGDGSRMIIGSPANDSASSLYKAGKIAVFSSNPNFELVTTVNGNGNVYPPTGLYTPGTNIILTAIPDEGWLFTGWSGSISDTDYNNTNKTITLMSYTSAIANFSNDADGDQILNAQENNIGTDPRVVTSSVEVYNAMSNRLSLVQAQEVMQDLRVGSKTFTIVDGTAAINMNIDKSGDLIDWTNTSYTIEGDIPADENKLFFRFRME